MGTRHLYWILTGPSFAVRTALSADEARPFIYQHYYIYVFHVHPVCKIQENKRKEKILISQIPMISEPLSYADIFVATVGFLSIFWKLIQVGQSAV